MLLMGKKIIFALTDAIYTYERTIPEIKRLIEEGAEVIPIMSYSAYKTSNMLEEKESNIDKIEKITSKKVIYTIEKAEKIINEKFDIMIIAPCSRKYNW